MPSTRRLGRNRRKMIESVQTLIQRDFARLGAECKFKLANEPAEAMLRLQRELLDVYDQASRDWLAQLKSEAELWSGLAKKLVGTRSVPDAIKSYQEWISQRMEMAAADAQRLSDECGTIMQKINRFDQWMLLRKHMTLGRSATTPF
jgi:hypothetical protein